MHLFLTDSASVGLSPGVGAGLVAGFNASSAPGVGAGLVAGFNASSAIWSSALRLRLEDEAPFDDSESQEVGSQKRQEGL